MNAPDQPDAALDEPFGPPSIQVEAVIPPVVVVMVAHDPGAWFEETLASVGAQTYANTSLLVVDTSLPGPDGATGGVRGRVAAVMPDAHLRTAAPEAGFGPAANEVLAAVEGASFYLFCHDDVRLEPDVVQIMVEEAFRSNAGVVGPKIVDWAHPERILQVGMGVDKTGAPAPYVERGELDQEQHDSVRDVFYVPGAATLVRADLFSALGGFDPDIDLLGEDLDLGWRAHVVGARVLVAPGARVGHLEALGLRRPIDDRRRLQMRHRLRTSRICYSRGTRLRVMPQAAFVALVEFVYGICTGRFRHAADVANAWFGRPRQRASLRRRRRDLAAHRRVPDRDVRRLQVRGSARLSGFLRGQLGGGEDRLGSVAGAGRDLVSNLRSPSARTSLFAWVIVLVLWAVGSRDLFTNGIPAVGQFVTFGSHPSSLVQEWMSGFRDVGLGAEAAAPTLIGAVGVSGAALFGALGLLRTLAITCALPIGAMGIWRLAGPLGSRRARIGALLVYAAVPVGMNAIARGRWDGAVIYAMAPWMANQLARASGLAPYDGVTQRSWLTRVLMLGLVTALAATVTPVAPCIVVAVAVAFALGGLLAGEWRGSGRMLGVGLAGALAGIALQLPWSATVVTGGWRALVGNSSVGGAPLTLSDITRFATGPFGDSPLAYAFLVVALLALLIGRRWRLSWAIRSWVLIAAGLATAFVSQGNHPEWFPAPEVLLAPVAVGVALSTALGVVAFEADLPDYRFGLRQIASLLAGVAFVLAVVPAIAGVSTGRWDLPSADFARPLSNLGAKVGGGGPYRVLWLGEQSLIPGAPWALTPERAGAAARLGDGRVLGMATSEAGMPDVSDLLPGPPDGATRHLVDAVALAASGSTTRLGALVAPMGVRYIVVPLNNAPVPSDTGPSTTPTRLLATLDQQLDLSDVDVIQGVVVYRNAAWGPVRAQLPPGTRFPVARPDTPAGAVPALAGAPTAAPDTQSFQSFTGTQAGPRTVYLGDAASSRWSLTVDGHGATRRQVLGWANAFEAPRRGSVALRYDTPLARHLELLGQLVLWLLVLGFLLRSRVRAEGARDLVELEAEGELA